MFTCPVPAETRERAGLVFGQVPADLHVPEVAGLQRRRLGYPGRTMGRGAGWGLELGSAVQTEQRVAVAPQRHHARCGALPSQLLQGERNLPRDLKPDLLAASSRGPGGVRGAGNSRALGYVLATRYRGTQERSVLRSQLLEVLDPEAVDCTSVALVLPPRGGGGGNAQGRRGCGKTVLTRLERLARVRALLGFSQPWLVLAWSYSGSGC